MPCFVKYTIAQLLGTIYMTYRAESDSDSATGRRSEIEITPEMIEAGVSELCGFNSDYTTYEDCVEAILGAAFAAARVRGS